MGRLRQNWIERTAPVLDPDITPDPIPSYWPGSLTYREIVEDEKVFAKYPASFWEDFRNGLESDKGIGALEAWRADIGYASNRRRRTNALHDATAGIEREAPNYVRALLEDQHGVTIGGREIKEGDVHPPPWGYVIFRTAGYEGTDTEKWQRAKSTWCELIEAQFSDNITRGAVGAAKARDRFQCVWVEGPEWAGASREKMAEHYRGMVGGLPTEAYRQYLFLCVDEQCMESLLAAPPKHQRHFSWMPMPYARAVAAHAGVAREMEEDEEGDVDEEPTGFSVAIESLVGSLYPVVARQMLDFRELALGVKDDEMWWAGGYAPRKIKS